MANQVLNRDQKLLRIDLITERKRRILAKKPVYKPNEGQQGVHIDTKSIRIAAAGNGSGKTALGVQEVIWWATGYNPVLNTFTKVPSTVVILLDSPLKVDQVWLPEIKKWFPLEDSCELRKNGHPYYNQITFKNGSQVLFMFHNQEDMVFEGIQLDYLVTDEPFPQRIWVSLTRGMRKKGAVPKVLILGTPVDQPWIYRDLWKKASSGERTDIGLHRFHSEVNKANMAEGYLERFAMNLTEHQKQVRLGGHFFHLEGLALAHLFDRVMHVVPRFPWPKGKPVVIAIDPHPAKGHFCIMLGATGDGRVYYLKELSSKSAPSAFALELKAFAQGYKVIDFVMDSLGETPGSGGDGNMSMGDKLRQRGVPVRSTSYDDKNDADFIQNIQQVLEVPDEKDSFGRRSPKLAIIEGNTGIIDNIESVQWLKYRNQEMFKDKLDITQKEYLACLKYAMKSNLTLYAAFGKLPRTKHSRPSPWSGRR